MATHIRPVRDGDFAAIAAVNRAAFGREDEAQLVAALHAAGHNDFELVAERDAGIVAHILFSPVSIEHGDDRLMLGLAPLAVLPDFQRQGIGTALARAALEALAASPYRAVVVLGDTAYYRRFGFGPASVAGLRSVYAAGDAFMAVALRAGGLAGYGGCVRYAPEFDGLE